MHVCVNALDGFQNNFHLSKQKYTTMNPSWKLKNQSELILNAEDGMAQTLSHDVVLITPNLVSHTPAGSLLHFTGIFP